MKETNRLYGVLNKRLADRAFLAGDYSIADMASYPWVVPYERQGQNLDDFPHLKRWFEAIQERPAIERAYARPRRSTRIGRRRWTRKSARYCSARPRPWCDSPRKQAAKERLAESQRKQTGTQQENAGDGHCEKRIGFEFFAHGTIPAAPSKRVRRSLQNCICGFQSSLPGNASGIAGNTRDGAR